MVQDAETDTSSKSAAVPYVPFATFCTALDYLKSHGMPSKIDSSAFPTFAGGTISHLLLSLRALGLITKDGDPSPELAILADETTRKQALAKLLPKAYAGLFHKVDISKASPSQLENALHDQNVRGATAKKAMAFLIKAAQFAGLPVSNHLIKRTRTVGVRKNGGRRTKQQHEKQQAEPPLPSPPQQANYSKVIRLPQASGVLTLSGDFDPLALRGEERELVYKLTDIMWEFENKKEKASE